MPKYRKAINFDLDSKILKTIFPHTAKPYSDIKKEMLKLGFEHRQYSGYNSIEPMSYKDIRKLMVTLKNKLPWLSTPGLIQKIDVTNIFGKEHDLSDIFKENPKIKSQPNTPPPQKSTLSINDLIQATPEPTEESKEGEIAQQGRDTLNNT